MSIGKRIKKMREEMGLCQEELGYMVGMSRYAISRLENAEDENVRLLVLKRIANALETDILKLISDTKHFQPVRDQLNFLHYPVL